MTSMLAPSTSMVYVWKVPFPLFPHSYGVSLTARLPDEFVGREIRVINPALADFQIAHQYANDE